eukprot:543902_1
MGIHHSHQLTIPQTKSSSKSIDFTQSPKTIIPDDLNTIMTGYDETAYSDPSIPSENNDHINYSLRLVPQSSIRSRRLNQNNSSSTPITPYLQPTTSLSLRPQHSTQSNHSNNNVNTMNPILISNGITGKFISSRICSIAANFWKENLVNLARSRQLEIGCSIFCGMLSSNGEMKKVMNANFNNSKKIESTSLKYLDMFGWLTRCLVTNDIDLYSLLTKLGTFHQKMGIEMKHF